MCMCMYFYIPVTTQGGFTGTVMVLFNKLYDLKKKAKDLLFYKKKKAKRRLLRLLVRENSPILSVSGPVCAEADGSWRYGVC